MNKEQDARINRARSLLQQVVNTREDGGGSLDLDLVEAQAKLAEADLRRQEKVTLENSRKDRVAGSTSRHITPRNKVHAMVVVDVR